MPCKSMKDTGTSVESPNQPLCTPVWLRGGRWYEWSLQLPVKWPALKLLYISILWGMQIPGDVIVHAATSPHP